MALTITNHPSPNHNSRRGVRVQALIMHATAGTNSLAHLCDPAPKTKEHPEGDPEKAVSAHDLIAKDGTIFHLVDYGRRAWHAGWVAIPGLSGDGNSLSIGIELENLNDGADPYPATQLDAAVELVQGLVSQFAIPRQQVVTHGDTALPTGRKTDPCPPAFDLPRFLDRVFGGVRGELHTLAMTVTHDGVRIRQRPTTDSAIVGQLRRNTVVLVDRIDPGEAIDGERDWAHLADGRGFVTMKFLQRSAPPRRRRGAPR